MIPALCGDFLRRQAPHRCAADCVDDQVVLSARGEEQSGGKIQDPRPGDDTAVADGNTA